MDDRTLRQKIIGKYGYVDQDDDARYHRPIIKKEVALLSMNNKFSKCFKKNLFFQDDKKMIRYRDGKIVSTKGERFTQVTKAESEEMKKSYVNIPNYDYGYI